MKLFIVGLGIRGTDQITQEGLRRIKEAGKVCYLQDPKLVENLFAALGVTDAENLTSLYRDGDCDNDNYRRMFQRLISMCREHGTVAYLVQGHPRLGSTLVQWLEACASRLGLEFEIVPGVSSFATLVNDVKRDPLEKGTVILDANRLLLYEQALEPSMDHYIYHVCSVGTQRTHLSDPARDNRIDLLKNHLLRYFPEDHTVMLVHSAQRRDSAPRIAEEKIGSLEKLLTKVGFGTTLFVPGVVNENISSSYLDLLQSTN